MKGVFDRQQYNSKAVVIRDASTISLSNQNISSGRMDLESAVRQPDTDGSVSANGDDTTAERVVLDQVETHQTSLYVDFFTLESILGEWQPSDPNMARVTILSELVDFLKAKGVQARIGRGPDILVCDRYPVDLERGNQPTDVDRLLEKMIWDSHIYGCVIGVAYGVGDQFIVEQLECVLEEFFEKEDMATIVLC